MATRLISGWIYTTTRFSVVLTSGEIRDALDRKMISDVSLVSLYEEIRSQKRDGLRTRKKPKSKPRKKEDRPGDGGAHQTASRTPEDKAKGNPYRKDNPLHRSYFHEIAPADKIPRDADAEAASGSMRKRQRACIPSRARLASLSADGDSSVDQEQRQGRPSADEPAA